MRRLILFRHAKTEERPPGREDFDRVLVERGRCDAVVVARALEAAGFAPDLALVSPAARTVETWDLIKSRFPAARLKLCPELYDATSEELAQAITSQEGDAETVIVIGHNPSLQDLAVAMLEKARAPEADIESLAAGFPTSSAACFAYDAPDQPRLERLFHARDHRDLA
jgi:phosphohistidine phosphatase